jgi:membrane protease YdiL (CAAX protease family)
MRFDTSTDLSPASTPQHHGLRGFAARRPITSFLIWLFTVGQAIAYTPLIAGLFGREWPTQPFIVATSIFGLALPTFLITWAREGWAGVRRLFGQVFHVRVSVWWYVGALTVIPMIAIAITVAVYGLPEATVPQLLSALGPHFLVSLAFLLLPNNLWEETAWAGLVQPELQKRHTPAMAALITAPFFALQHLSVTWGNGFVVGAMLMVLLTVLVIPFRMLTGWIFNRTGSIFLVGVVHAVGDAIAVGSGFEAGYLEHLYGNQMLVGLSHTFAIFILGFVVLAATRGRLR